MLTNSPTSTIYTNKAQDKLFWFGTGSNPGRRMQLFKISINLRFVKINSDSYKLMFHYSQG